MEWEEDQTHFTREQLEALLQEQWQDNIQKRNDDAFLLGANDDAPGYLWVPKKQVDNSGNRRAREGLRKFGVSLNKLTQWRELFAVNKQVLFTWAGGIQDGSVETVKQDPNTGILFFKVRIHTNNDGMVSTTLIDIPEEDILSPRYNNGPATKQAN